MTVLTKAGRKIFFAHVPKTGGTYVEDLFVRNGYHKSFWCSDPERQGLKTSFQHFERALFEPCIDFSTIAHSFITVRHPADRVVSEFRNSGRQHDLATWLDRLDRRLRADPYLLDNHLRPQVDFFRPGMEIYRQEDRFDAGWAQKLDARFDLGFSVFEVERRRNTQVHAAPLTAEEAERLKTFCHDRFAEDYAFFGYEEDGAKILKAPA